MKPTIKQNKLKILKQLSKKLKKQKILQTYWLEEEEYISKCKSNKLSLTMDYNKFNQEFNL